MGVLSGSPAGKKEFSKTNQTIVFEVPGVDEAFTGPETASGRNWAARASWESRGPFGSDLGVSLGPKFGPERGPGTS